VQNKLNAALLCLLLNACSSTVSPVTPGGTLPDKTKPDSQIFVPAGTFHAEVEGPDTDNAGNLYAVNFGGAGAEHKGSIGKVTPDGKASLLLRLPPGSTGNGIQIDARGVMWIADYTGHHIWRYANGHLTSFVHEPRMHQPNDLALTRSGVIFASDPDWKNSKGQLWRIGTDGKARLIDQTGTSNGIEVSPDQRWLYVNESAQRKIWVYPLDQQLETGEKKLLIEFADFGLDGMRCDSQGNLYIARYGKGTVVKLNPQGTVLKEFTLNGQYPTNVALSPDERWLYVTMQRDGSIERIALQS
jgi:sugar lactone lactonase YvrE